MGNDDLAFHCACGLCYLICIHPFRHTLYDCEKKHTENWGLSLITDSCINPLTFCIALVPGGCCYLSWQVRTHVDDMEWCKHYWCFLLCCCNYAALNRLKLREKYEIRGSGSRDFCAHLWCWPCAVAQEVNFIHKMRDSEKQGDRGRPQPHTGADVELPVILLPVDLPSFSEPRSAGLVDLILS